MQQGEAWADGERDTQNIWNKMLHQWRQVAVLEQQETVIP